MCERGGQADGKYTGQKQQEQERKRRDRRKEHESKKKKKKKKLAVCAGVLVAVKYGWEEKIRRYTRESTTP